LHGWRPTSSGFLAAKCPFKAGHGQKLTRNPLFACEKRKVSRLVLRVMGMSSVQGLVEVNSKCGVKAKVQNPLVLRFHYAVFRSRA